MNKNTPISQDQTINENDTKSVVSSAMLANELRDASRLSIGLMKSIFNDSANRLEELENSNKELRKQLSDANNLIAVYRVDMPRFIADSKRIDYLQLIRKDLNNIDTGLIDYLFDSEEPLSELIDKSIESYQDFHAASD